MTRHADRVDRATSLVPWTPAHSDAGTVVVGIAWAGAGAAPFRSWALLFNPSLSLYGARLPGRESRAMEAPLHDIPRMAEDLAREVAALGPRRVVLFGHCTGALIAFELARVLGPAVVALVVASQLPPQRAAAAAAAELAAEGGPADHYLAQELRDEPEVVGLLRPAIESDVRAVTSYLYRPEGGLSVPVVVFYGANDSEISRVDLHEWRDATTGPVSIQAMAGADHLFSGESWLSLGRALLDVASGRDPD